MFVGREAVDKLKLWLQRLRIVLSTVGICRRMRRLLDPGPDARLINLNGNNPIPKLSREELPLPAIVNSLESGPSLGP